MRSTLWAIWLLVPDPFFRRLFPAAEFTRFLRYAQRSCNEVKSQLYAALDQTYITQNQFDEIYEQATQTHRKIGGFIRYLANKSP